MTLKNESKLAGRKILRHLKMALYDHEVVSYTQVISTSGRGFDFGGLGKSRDKGERSLGSYGLLDFLSPHRKGYVQVLFDPLSVLASSVFLARLQKLMSSRLHIH